ncbi:MAG: decarboxylating 6-phosphogluconate dehydrogenase [Acidimicrobiia bacterium]|nr:decarboxylating 6-phosphogluconate dehydrogenase [Acidimicrobiia bacterium]
MQLGMIGLGKMGSFMTERLTRGGHEVIGYDRDEAAMERVRQVGAGIAASVSELVAALAAPRSIWVMVPDHVVGAVLDDLVPHLDPGDVVIDGGNSNFNDTLMRGSTLGQRGISYVDVGTSGGVWGLNEGYSMMVGGTPEAVSRLTPLFETLAPAPDKGWGHVGPVGSGHFAKMVHNGIEYGMMQAYAEGFDILRAKEEFGLDLHQIAEVWRFGSVIRSWLLDLTSEALVENPTMDGIAPFVPDSGEGRWAVMEAIHLNVPAPVITHSLIARIESRNEYSYGYRLASAMRNKFGGHSVKKEP